MWYEDYASFKQILSGSTNNSNLLGYFCRPSMTIKKNGLKFQSTSMLAICSNACNRKQFWCLNNSLKQKKLDHTLFLIRRHVLDFWKDSIDCRIVGYVLSVFCALFLFLIPWFYILFNRPLYRYGGHTELIYYWIKYHRMPRGHEHISFVFWSAFRDIFS